jgi:hypothetical protein
MTWERPILHGRVEVPGGNEVLHVVSCPQSRTYPPTRPDGPSSDHATVLATFADV